MISIAKSALLVVPSFCTGAALRAPAVACCPADPGDRAVDVQHAGGNPQEEQDGRREILETALAWIESSQTGEQKLEVSIYKELKRNYTTRLNNLHVQGADESEESHREHVASRQNRIAAMRDALRVERETAVRLRNQGKIGDEVLRRLEYELDLSETKLSTVR